MPSSTSAGRCVITARLNDIRSESTGEIGPNVTGTKPDGPGLGLPLPVQTSRSRGEEAPCRRSIPAIPLGCSVLQLW
jgi:hypothetical protein